MILRLDPRFPVVWRSPMSVQIGIDPPLVTIDTVSQTTEQLIAALVAGTTRPGLTMITGADSAECERLLEALRPVLVQSTPATDARTPPTIVVAGVGATAAALAAALAHCGVRVLTTPDPAQHDTDLPDAAAMVGHFVLSPALRGAWLRRDVPHLPVVFSDGGVRIGPLIRPGTGPCLHCLELHHRDMDAAWPALASQLLGRSSTADAAPLALEAAAEACRMLLAATAPATELAPAAATAMANTEAARSLDIRADTSERLVCDWQPHPDCDCRGIGLLGEFEARRGRRESDWAAALRRDPARFPTRRVQANVEPG